ncbi:MAG: nucleoside-diphosphate kinase [Bacteroidota bacterium]|nr:nucleoside-diphosphate kinase [Bacteroidota bacterium]
MSGNKTLTMIKPKAVREGNIGPILNKIAEGGFKIIALKLTRLNYEEARNFYEVHKGRPFYENLCKFMSEGPILAAVLEKENAVQAYRDFIGPTNPEDADGDSIRGLYGTDLQQNAVHGSDSDKNALKEAGFFFSEREILSPDNS